MLWQGGYITWGGVTGRGAKLKTMSWLWGEGMASKCKWGTYIKGVTLCRVLDIVQFLWQRTSVFFKIFLLKVGRTNILLCNATLAPVLMQIFSSNLPPPRIPTYFLNVFLLINYWSLFEFSCSHGIVWILGLKSPRRNPRFGTVGFPRYCCFPRVLHPVFPHEFVFFWQKEHHAPVQHSYRHNCDRKGYELSIVFPRSIHLYKFLCMISHALQAAIQCSFWVVLVFIHIPCPVSFSTADLVMPLLQTVPILSFLNRKGDSFFCTKSTNSRGCFSVQFQVEKMFQKYSEHRFDPSTVCFGLCPLSSLSSSCQPCGRWVDCHPGGWSAPQGSPFLEHKCVSVKRGNSFLPRGTQNPSGSASQHLFPSPAQPPAGLTESATHALDLFRAFFFNCHLGNRLPICAHTRVNQPFFANKF